MAGAARDLGCTSSLPVAQKAQLSPDQRLLTAHGPDLCFVSDGCMLARLQRTKGREALIPCELAFHASPPRSSSSAGAEVVHGGCRPIQQHQQQLQSSATPSSSAASSSAPIHLLSINNGPSSATQPALLAVAAGSALQVFAVHASAAAAAAASPPAAPGAPPVASCSDSPTEESLQEPGGSRWRALAWHPVWPDILAATSQKAVSVCLCAAPKEQQQHFSFGPVHVTVLARLTPLALCRSPVVNLAWLAMGTSAGSATGPTLRSACGDSAPDAGGSHAQEERLAVAWGQDAQLLQWSSSDVGHGLNFWSTSCCVRHALPLGARGPPRALLPGPAPGSLLCTFDSELSLGAPGPVETLDLEPGGSRGAAQRPTTADKRRPNGTAASVLTASAPTAAATAGTVVSAAARPSLNRAAGPARPPPPAASPPPPVLDLRGIIGRAQASSSLASPLACLLDGSLLASSPADAQDGVLDLRGKIGAVEPSNVTVPISSAPDLAQSPSPLSPSMDNDQPDRTATFVQSLIPRTDKCASVPSSFLLHSAPPPASSSAQLCILFPPRPAVGPTTSATATSPSSPSSSISRVDLALPRPDLLHCVADVIVVGSSCGPPIVQVFRVIQANAAAALAATAASPLPHSHSLTEPPTTPVQLQPIACFSLRGPSSILSPQACLLRGLLLRPDPDDRAISAPGAGAAAAALQLVALMGMAEERVQPTFLSIRKTDGPRPAKLAPLLCCMFTDSALTFGAPRFDGSAASPAEHWRAGAATAAHDALLQAVSSLVQGLEQRLQARIEEMEQRLMQRLSQIEARITLVNEKQ